MTDDSPDDVFPDGLPKPGKNPIKEKSAKMKEELNPGSEATNPFVASDAQRALVRQMASHGLGPKQIRFYIKDANGKAISKQTLEKYFDQDMADGLNESCSLIGARVLKTATKSKNPFAAMQAAQLFLKCKAGWKETDKLEVTGEDGEPIAVNTGVTKEFGELIRGLVSSRAAGPDEST